MLLIKRAENAQRTIAYIRVSSKRQVDDGVSMDGYSIMQVNYSKRLNLPMAALLVNRLLPESNNSISNKQ